MHLAAVLVACSVLSHLVLVGVHYCDGEEPRDDHSLPSVQVRKLEEFMGITLDEETLISFPVLRDGQVSMVNIPNEIGNKHSKAFGVQLLGIDRLTVIEMILAQPEFANIKFIKEWFLGKDKEPVTLATLIGVIRNIGLDELADMLTNTGTLLNIMNKPYIPRLVKKYSHELKLTYENDPVVDSQLWLPKRLHGRNISFIDLELIKNGAKITSDELVSSFRAGTRVLFVGRPGVGKSTIMRYFSKTLIHPNNYFYLVVRWFLGSNKEIDNLAALLNDISYHLYDYNDMSIITNYIERTQGEGVCFLLDGLDEYINSHQCFDCNTDNRLDYIYNILTNNAKLAKAVVLVSSRPSAIRDNARGFDYTIEINGFEEKSIEKYINNLGISQTKSLTIHQYLDTHPNVRRLCYLPLHLSMLVYITLDTDTGLAIGDTETQLYTSFLILTMFEANRHTNQTIRTLKECSDGNSDLCLLLRSISKTAFDGIKIGKQTFTTESLQGLPVNINIPKRLEALNLLQIEKFYDKRGQAIHTYSYSHPTFQEYFAAFHLTSLSVEEQMKHVQNSTLYLPQVFKFYMGLIGSELNYSPSIVYEHFSTIAYQLLAEFRITTLDFNQLFVIKIAHEIGHHTHFIAYLQNVDIISKTGSLYVDINSHNSHDCWYIGYILTLSPINELYLHYSEESNFELCTKLITNYINNHHLFPGVNVKELVLLNANLQFSEFKIGKVTNIFKFVKIFKHHLNFFCLKSAKITNHKSMSELAIVLKSFKMLKSLELIASVDVIKKGLFLINFQRLNHLKLGIFDRNTPTPNNLLQFINLQQLNTFSITLLWSNNFSNVNMTQFFGGLSNMKTLKKLNIHLILHDGFKQNGATELVRGIQKVTSVKDLSLSFELGSNKGLGNITYEELIESLINLNSILKDLSLNIMFSDLSNAFIKLAKRLKELTELQNFSLSASKDWCNYNCKGTGLALANSLKDMKNLTTLKLSISYDYDGIHFSYRSLCKTPQLVRELLSKLKYLNNLKILDLSTNKICDENIVYLAEALTHMNRLTFLDLSDNNIGENVAQLLLQWIESNHPNISTLLLDGKRFHYYSKVRKYFMFLFFESVNFINTQMQIKDQNIKQQMNMTSKFIISESSHIFSMGVSIGVMTIISFITVWTSRKCLHQKSASSLSANTQWPHPPETLGIRHLDVVLVELKSVVKWQPLGLQLGLLNSTIDKIDEDFRRVDECKRNMLAAWLNQEDSVRQKGGPLWEQLVTALRTCNERRLADGIENKYLSKSSHDEDESSSN